MDALVRELLARHDDAVGTEFPSGVTATATYAELHASVVAVQSALRDELGLQFERDGSVQDASFHDELRILHRDAFGPRSTVISHSEITIRFSNFGRLFIVFSGAFPSIPDKYRVEEIRLLVARFGWHEVPTADLGELYDGVHPLLRDGRTTWWIRFFDYL